MKRLTEWRDGHGALIHGDGYTRLAQYEDTGLSPEDVIDLMGSLGNAISVMADYHLIGDTGSIGNIDHIHGLLKAEKDGRIVVLPCKVGDVVWKIENNTILPMVAKWIEWYEDEFEVAIEYAPRAQEFHGFADFGKTIFLTREEAEAALEAQKGGAKND